MIEPSPMYPTVIVLAEDILLADSYLREVTLAEGMKPALRMLGRTLRAAHRVLRQQTILVVDSGHRGLLGEEIHLDPGQPVPGVLVAVPSEGSAEALVRMLVMGAGGIAEVVTDDPVLGREIGKIGGILVSPEDYMERQRRALALLAVQRRQARHELADTRALVEELIRASREQLPDPGEEDRI